MIALAVWAGAAAAQETDGAEGAAILTIDPERLFTETAFGRRVQREIEAAAMVLAAENRAIEAELEAEERDLTERRPEMVIEDFREVADAFDAKVDRIRAEQDAKEREVQGLQDSEQQRFFREIGPILRAMLEDRGALVLLDRRGVLVVAGSVDITEDAIARIDADLGDGSQ